MPTPSIAPALAARGIPVPLADGTTVQLRYTMASVIALERSFGNIARVQVVTNEAAAALEASAAVANGTATDAQRKLDAEYTATSVFQVVCDLLGAGLLDVQAQHPRTGEVVWLGEHPDAVARLLVPSGLQDYLDAFGRAFSEAFATVHTEGGGANPPTVAATTPRTPGRSGGTSRSAAAGTARKRSGA